MGEVVQMHFTVVDYVIFVLLLVASAGIGLFYAFSGGRQRTTQVVCSHTRGLWWLDSLVVVSLGSVWYWRLKHIWFTSGVPDGWPLHELSACFSVSAGHISVSRGHPGRSFWGLCIWDTVLVSGLLLLLWSAHPSSCVHTSLLQAPAVQCLWGTII